jgi:hypothetical protein
VLLTGLASSDAVAALAGYRAVDAVSE